MIRTTNRFLSVIFACMMGIVVVGNAFAANESGCTGRDPNGSYCGYSNVANFSSCYYSSADSSCKKCPSTSSYWKQRGPQGDDDSFMYGGRCGGTRGLTCNSVPKGGSSCGGQTYSHGQMSNYSNGHIQCTNCEEGVSGRYPVFTEGGDWDGTVAYCHKCPDDLDAAGVDTCYESGFTCKSGFTKTKQYYTDPLYSCSKEGYACVCENNGTNYLGYNGLYCGSCSGESDGYDRTSCSYDTFTCAAHSYKVAYKTRPSGYAYMQARYGRYECYRCPRIANGTAFGISSGVDPYYMSTTGWIWSTTSRCTASQSSLQSDANGGKYKWENITPDYYMACPSDNTSCSEDQKVQKPCADRTERYQDDNGYWVYPSDVRYSTEELPNRTNMADEGQECYYTGKKYYYNVPAGYGVTNNNTMNATTVACTGNWWNDGTDISCQPLPAHAVVKEDHTGFICNQGYFQSGKTCVRCPMNVDMEISYSDWDYGTTSAPGATSSQMCYVLGQSLGSDDGGEYYAGAICKYNRGSFDGYYIVCLEYNEVTYGGGLETCKSALAAFARNVMGSATDQGQDYHWAEDFLEQAVQTNCSYNKQNGWYQGAGVMLTDANMVKQLFIHPQYNVLNACHGIYVWTF